MREQTTNKKKNDRTMTVHRRSYKFGYITSINDNRYQFEYYPYRLTGASVKNCHINNKKKN
ncbi:MAG: hypothetical protein ACL7BU_14400 [Candidatus Phlomobacter fragariae]